MDKLIIISVIAILSFGLTAGVLAGDDISMVPGKIDAAELEALEKITYSSSQTARIQKTAKHKTVDVGVATLSYADFMDLKEMVKGLYKADSSVAGSIQNNMVDIGITKLPQHDFEMLRALVKQGPFCKGALKTADAEQSSDF